MRFFCLLTLFLLCSVSASAETRLCLELFTKTDKKLRSVDFLKAGRYSEALILADRWLEAHPLLPTAYGLKAQAQMALEDFAGTVATIEQALKLPPHPSKNPVILLQMLASAQSQLAQKGQLGFDAVVATTDQILATHPKNKIALDLRAKALRSLGLDQKAQDANKALMDVELPRLYSILQKRTEEKNEVESVQTLKSILKLNPNDAYARGRLTNFYMSKARWKEAEESVEAELAIHPQNLVALGLRVRLFQIQGDTKEAFEAAQLLPLHDPYRTFYIGSVYIQIQRYQRALQVLESAPHKTLDLLWKIAQASYLMGDRRKAKNTLIQMVQRSETVDLRVIATLLKIESEGKRADDGLAERLMRGLERTEQQQVLQLSQELERRGLWAYVPSTPALVPTSSLNNPFWHGLANIPVDGQTVKATW